MISFCGDLSDLFGNMEQAHSTHIAMSPPHVSVNHNTVIVQLTEPLNADEHIIVTQDKTLPKQFVRFSLFQVTSLIFAARYLSLDPRSVTQMSPISQRGSFPTLTMSFSTHISCQMGGLTYNRRATRRQRAKPNLKTQITWRK